MDEHVVLYIIICFAWLFVCAWLPCEGGYFFNLLSLLYRTWNYAFLVGEFLIVGDQIASLRTLFYGRRFFSVVPVAHFFPSKWPFAPQAFREVPTTPDLFVYFFEEKVSVPFSNG